MELLNVVRAQSVWLFDANDLNPHGKNFFTDLIEWMKEHYQFQKSPSTPEDLDPSKGLAFKQGAFNMGGEQLTVELTIYNDGLIANSYSSTRATDRFLEDALSGAVREFDLQYSKTLVRSKTYLSEITVLLKEPLSKINPKLAAFADKISQVHGHKNASPFEVGGISFWSDVSMAALKFAPFSIERRLNAPFSENRFYSKAPIHTDEHLNLIADFEMLLASSL
jgi:hypothetical protein